MKQGLKEPSALKMQAVWDDYRAELEQVEILIQKTLNSRVPLLNQIAHYILSSGGKRIRPLLAIIAAKLFGYTGQQHTVVATLVEYIHTATLLHDDVIDQGDIRRGKKSVRALWGNHASILVGDYFYVSAAANSLDLDNQEVNYTLLGACSRMIEGEMFQDVSHSDLHATDDTYLNIIENKTASLISAACRLGAIVGGASEPGKEALTQYGHHLGMAFQLSDDTLDYAAEKDLLGKSLGNDLQEGKVTLPLLHLLRNCTEEEKLKIEQIVQGNESMNKEFGYIVTMMHRHGSIRHAMGVAQHYVEQAKACLADLKDSSHKRALQTVADYVVTRDH
jgi:octaprenyl-diphosphate synthase